MIVEIALGDRRLAVSLVQLKPTAKAAKETKEAVPD